MKCNNCGIELNENNQFCPNCGAKNEINATMINLNSSNAMTDYNDANAQNYNQTENFNNANINNSVNMYNYSEQIPVKTKKKPYWLLGVLPFTLGFLFKIIQVIINLIIDANEGYMIEENMTLAFVGNLFGILSLILWIAVIPCLIIMIVMYTKRTPNEIQNDNMLINQVLNSNLTLEDKMLAVYIGKNYQKIMNNKFSIPAFFLNWIYMLYRKMYIPAIIGMAGITILNLIPIISFLYTFIVFGIMIILGIFFNKWYIDYARKNVEKIIRENQNTDQTYLISLCQNKGGTNIGYAILIYLGFVMIQGFTNIIIEMITKM